MGQFTSGSCCIISGGGEFESGLHQKVIEQHFQGCGDGPVGERWSLLLSGSCCIRSGGREFEPGRQHKDCWVPI